MLMTSLYRVCRKTSLVRTEEKDHLSGMEFVFRCASFRRTYSTVDCDAEAGQHTGRRD